MLGSTAPLRTTGQLADIVKSTYPGYSRMHPATRTFQALRIAVNDELGQLERTLPLVANLLTPGGRLAIISFHSLEDRIVKQFLRDASGAVANTSRHIPAAPPAFAPTFADLGKAQRAGEAELARNPRSRSATLRAATRTIAPARAAAKFGRAA